MFFFDVVLLCDGDHRDLHVLTHSFPTPRSSDLRRWIGNVAARKRIDGLDLADRVANIDLVPVHRKIETTQEGRGEDAAKRVSFAPFGFDVRVATEEIADRKSTRLNSSH